jgi:hypothetical protein
MKRAVVEPMSNADLIPRMGLYKVVIYEGDQLSRIDVENAIISLAERRVEELNYQFTGKREMKGKQKR